MKRAVLGHVLLLMGGCGAQPFPAPADCPGDPDCLGDSSAVDPAAFVPPDAAVAWPPAPDPMLLVGPGADPATFEPPPLTPVGLDPLVLTLLALDPFAFAIFEPADAPELLSLFMDNLALDLVSRIPSRSTFTFLELLCIETGQPEFVCRQRYGN